MNQELLQQIEELNDRQQVLFLRLLTAAAAPSCKPNTEGAAVSKGRPAC